MAKDHPNKRSAFISHASTDSERAIELCESLESQGYKCWIAPRDVRPGKEYGAEIIRGIESSSCLVILLSDAANNSTYVRRVVERAVSKSIPVFPFRIEEILPSKGLELFISTTHWIDAWRGAFGTHVQTLIGELSGTSIAPPVRKPRLKVPRWVYNAGAVLIIAGVVAMVNHFTGKSDPGQQGLPQGFPITIEDSYSQAIDATGVDPATIGKEDLTLTSNLARNDQIEIELEHSVPLGKLLPHADGVYFAFDDGEFFKASYASDKKISYRDLDQKALLEMNEIKVRFDLRDGRLIGPFSYPFELPAKLQQDRMIKARNAISLENRASLIDVASIFSIDIKDLPDDIMGIDLGYEPGQLSREIRFETFQSRADTGTRVTSLEKIPVVVGEKIWGKWVSETGKNHTIAVIQPKPMFNARVLRELKAKNPDAVFPIGVRIQSKTEGGPELYAFYSKEKFHFSPAVWLEARNVRFRVGKGSWKPAEKSTSSDKETSAGHSFSFDTDALASEIEIEYHWSSGDAPATYSYEITNPEAIRFKAECRRFASSQRFLGAAAYIPHEDYGLSPEELNARREKKTAGLEYTESLKIYQDEEAVAQKRSLRNHAATMKLIDRGLGHIPQQPGTIVCPFSGRPDLSHWFVVKKVRYGTKKGELTELATPTYGIEEHDLGDKPTRPEDVLLLELPLEANEVHYELELLDGTTRSGMITNIPKVPLP